MLGGRAARVHAGRYAEQTSGSLHCLDGPLATDALDHPTQDRPKVAIDGCFVDRFQSRDDHIDLNAGRKRFAASPNEDQPIDRSGRHLHIARLRKADAVKIEGVDEEGTEFWIVTEAILGQNERQALAVKRWLRDHGYHASRRRNSTMWAAISGPESSCRKCRPVTRCGPSACGSNCWKRGMKTAGSNTSSSRPQISSAGKVQADSSCSSHAKRSNARASASSGIQRGQVQVSSRLAAYGSTASYAACACS